VTDSVRAELVHRLPPQRGLVSRRNCLANFYALWWNTSASVPHFVNLLTVVTSSWTE
jgi:hypothetical protein